MTRPARVRETALVLFLALAATYPLFVDTFRAMIFQTAPRDDYAPYLMRMVGAGGEVPGAPHAYRVLSVAAAIPFYHLLPVYVFRNLPPTDRAYLRATEALAFVSWLSLAACAAVTFRCARDRFGAGRAASLAAMLALLLFARYTALGGLDALALLLIAGVYYSFERPAAFATLVVVAAGFNEKVWIVASLLVSARVVDTRSVRRYRVHAAACALAIILYASAAAHFRVAGIEKPSDPRPMLTHAPLTLSGTFSLKGLAQNAFPTLLCLGAYAWTARRLPRHGAFWTRWDVIVPLGLATIGVAMNVGYTLGRLVLHSLPLILPALAGALELRAVVPETRGFTAAEIDGPLARNRGR